jgi:tetratricopeptide (TPR) repeat protein
MNIFTKRLGLLLVAFLLAAPVWAQRNVTHDSPMYEYNTAMELFQKEKYGAAQRYFKYVYEHIADKQQDIKANSYFYMGVCAANLTNDEADFLLKDFIRHYPVHANVPQAHFYLGRFYFSKKQYKKVLENFNEVDERNIKPEDMAEYDFKKGYAYFATKDYAEAKYYFHEARQYEGQYKKKAIYYAAHIAYEEKQYEAALNDFLLLKDDPAYQEAVPFYLTQIYFIQGRYEDLIAIAPPLLANASDKTEIDRTLALSYYNLGRYSEALPYFEYYLAANKGEIDRNDNYAIGYTYYQNQKYKEAINYLSKATGEQDLIAQNSYYIIGDCYLQQRMLNFASQSFYEASKYDFDEGVKEDALYNYAKLQYETSSSPFNSAIKALEQYTTLYPYSTRAEEANSYLSKIYLSTKNYQGAINSLEKVSSKNPDLLKAYQRCTHFRALELINNRSYSEAKKLIDKSLVYPMNKNIHTANLYWKAETEYRAGNYKNAYYAFQNYYKYPTANKDANYPISYYSYGYSALKLNKYEEAKNGFNSFLNYEDQISNEDMIADAMARRADCYFMLKDLKSAVQSYEKCEDMQRNNADYAVYQQAKCFGYLNNTGKKVEILDKLVKRYPKSPFCDDAEYDLATTYHAQNNYAQAIVAYQNFIKKYPKSQYIRQAYNKLALAYLNTQKTDEAIRTFKYVFETYPGSQEAKDALANLETIYSEEGNTGEFFDYIRNKSTVNISLGRQDSIAFKAAETKYNRGDCEAATKSFDDYLRQFPNGLFAAQVYFYKGECEYSQMHYDKALAAYEALVTKYKTQYNETAIRKIATIYYNDKNYAAAQNYFVKLIECATTDINLIFGYNGAMRSSFELKQYLDALQAAQVIINSKNSDDELKNDARLIAGKSAIEVGNYSEAKKHLSTLAHSNSNDIAAEAAYLCAYIEFKLNNLDACEKKISEMLADDYSSEYWYASTFILYGDLYAAKGNYFQARHTYQSIVDNYEGDDLREVAREKIRLLDEKEQQEKALKEKEANSQEPFQIEEE